MLAATLYAAAGPRRHCRNGLAAFSLLELVTVLGVVAVLAALSVGSTAHGLRNRALRAKAQADLAVIATALEDFRRHHGGYPRVSVSEDLFAALAGERDAANAVLASRLRPFLSPDGLAWPDPDSDVPGHVALDPWGRAYRYVYAPGSAWRAPGYVLYSTGPDGFAGAHGSGIVPGQADGDADNVYLP